MSTAHTQLVADRYRLVQPLGQGGMGRVWKARDEVLHRDVAIKELVPPPGLTPEERQEMRERSLREARAIARLNNINVVRVFDVLRTDADPWIVMEYVPSRSLQDVLAKDGPVPAVRAAEIGLGVLGALRAAHRSGVMHRDVKPGNVLLGNDGRVVLTDFGLATVPGDPNVTRTGLVLGSPAYISPERARTGSAGPEADMWSLGATLFAAVEGHSPYARPSAIATLSALATEPPPPAKKAGALKPVLNGLLRKDPALRMKADEAERLLQRAAGKRPRVARSLLDGVRRPSPLGTPRPPRNAVVPAQRPPRDVSDVAPVSPPPIAALVTPPPPMARPAPPPELPPTLTDAPAVESSEEPTAESAPEQKATEATARSSADAAATVVAPAPASDSGRSDAEPSGAERSDAKQSEAKKSGTDRSDADPSGTEPPRTEPSDDEPSDEAVPADAVTSVDRIPADAATSGSASGDTTSRDETAVPDAPARDSAPARTEDGSAPTSTAADPSPASTAVDAAPVSAGDDPSSGSTKPDRAPRAFAVAAVPARPAYVARRTPALRDKRMLWIAAGVVALLVLTVMLVVATRDGDQPGSRTAGPGAPTASAATGGGAPQPSATAQPSPSAPASSSTAGPTPPPSAPGFVLPAGWQMYRDPTGFSVPIRPEWQVNRDGGGRVLFLDPSRQRMLMIDQTDSPQPDPVADWKSKEDHRRSMHSNYQRVGQIRAVDYGLKAADWEWLYTGDNGTRMHVRNRGLVAAKDKAYAIYWETPEATWAQSLADYDVIAQGFKPVRGKAA